MDALYEGIGVSLRQLSICPHANAMLPRGVRTRPRQMHNDGRAVGTNHLRLLNWFALLATVLADKAIRTAIKQDLLESAALDVLLDYWKLPEPT